MKILRYVPFVICLCHLTANAASYECAKASTNIERKICSNTQLSQLDDILAKIYKTLMSSLVGESPKKELKNDQRNWIRERNLCSNVSCIQDAYNSRIEELCRNLPLLQNNQECKSILDSQGSGLYINSGSQNEARPKTQAKLNSIELQEYTDTPTLASGTNNSNILVTATTNHLSQSTGSNLDKVEIIRNNSTNDIQQDESIKKHIEQRRVEQERLHDLELLAEEQRLAEEKLLAQQMQAAEENRLTEEKRLANIKRLREEWLQAEEKRIANEQILAEESRLEAQQLYSNHQDRNKPPLSCEKFENYVTCKVVVSELDIINVAINRGNCSCPRRNPEAEDSMNNVMRKLKKEDQRKYFYEDGRIKIMVVNNDSVNFGVLIATLLTSKKATLKELNEFQSAMLNSLRDPRGMYKFGDDVYFELDCDIAEIAIEDNSNVWTFSFY